VPSADRIDSVYVAPGCTGGSFIIITNECRYTNDLLCNRLSKWMAMEIKPHEVGPIPNRPATISRLADSHLSRAPADSHLSRARTRARALTLTPTPIDPACAPILMPTHDLAQPTHTHVRVNCDHVSLRERETPRHAARRGAGAGGFKRTAGRCIRQPTRRVISSSKSSPSRTRCASPRTGWLASPPSTSAFATTP